MGIDAHAHHLLRYARRNGPLGSTVTLGRMVVHMGPKARQRLTGAAPEVRTVYGEEVLAREFGATSVDSIDNSSYEGATIVADMNQPLPESVGSYETVIDFGCMEHIFDVRQALRNITSLSAPGGRILHVLPANGYCGHGFYQYSPELFFSYYTPRNGFEDTEVFVADLLDTRHWFKVSPPSSGRRVNLRSSSEMLVLVMTRHARAVEDFEIQQSDYVYEWAQGDEQSTPRPASAVFKARLREWLFGNALTSRFAHELDSALAPAAPKRLNARHPALKRLRTSEF